MLDVKIKLSSVLEKTNLMLDIKTIFASRKKNFDARYMDYVILPYRKDGRLKDYATEPDARYKD